MDREFVYLVYGASGFTGHEVALSLAKVVASADPLSPPANTKWAIGGRSQAKLAAVCDRASAVGPAPAVLVADAADDRALFAAFRRCSVVINCAGPFASLGPRVVAACIDAGAHYVDISGEPCFLLDVMLREHDRAREAGIFVVCCAGFDSIPAEMGCLYAANAIHAALASADGYNAANQITHVESFMKLDAGSPPASTLGHVTTLVCALHGLSTVSETRRLRASLPSPPSRPCPVVKPPPVRKGLFRERRASHAGIDPWTTLFIGADSAVVKQTNRLTALGLTRMQDGSRINSYCAYVVVGYTYTSAFLFLIYSVVLYVMSMTSIGQGLVMRFPRLFTRDIFSNEGPSAHDRSRTKVTLDFYADRFDASSGALLARAVTRVSIRDPGYTATALMALASAQTLVEDKNSLPGCGGVFTPGAVFANTKLEARLLASKAMRMDVLHVSKL
jgi:short subunit dehydrogenase-like uncharacterized protein